MLRPETANDLPYLRRLYASTREHEFAAVRWPATARQAFVEQQFALQHQQYVRTYNGADFLIVQNHGNSIGRYYLWHAEADYLIIDISLGPDMRGRGVGSALIGHTQSLAAERGCGVRLHVRRDNEAARRLYLRLGFTPGACDEVDAYLPMRWQPMD